MDANLQVMVAIFGLTNLANGTFFMPLLSTAGEGHTSSSQLTGVQIAGLVIGVVLFVTLLIVLVQFAVAVPAAELNMAKTALSAGLQTDAYIPTFYIQLPPCSLFTRPMF